jgi:hypothetical protein
MGKAYKPSDSEDEICMTYRKHGEEECTYCFVQKARRIRATRKT